MISISLETKSQAVSVAKPIFETLTKYPKVRDFTMSNIGNEAYITIQSPLEELSVIACLKLKNNIWETPEIVAFSGKHKDMEPFLSPNGLRLYFASNRSLSDTTSTPKNFDIWYVERKNLKVKWSEPINIKSPVNSKYDEFYPTVANNNNLYFTRNSPDTKGKDDIFFSEWKNNSYKLPVSLSDSINSAGYEFNSYISPDESFIIYSGYNREDGYGSGDLYISFKNEDKAWSQSINLGKEVNSAHMDYCPFVNFSTNTLYFTSRRSSINNTKKYNSLNEFVKEINKYENGFSRIYKVSILNKLKSK